MREEPWPPPATYAADDPVEERRGLPMERGRFCEGCRQRFFAQTAVAESYIVELEELGGNWQEAFLAQCEITRHYVSFPKACTTCLRKQLTPEAISASHSGMDGRPIERRTSGSLDDPGYRGRLARFEAAREYLASSSGEEKADWDPGSTFD